MNKIINFLDGLGVINVVKLSSVNSNHNIEVTRKITINPLATMYYFSIIGSGLFGLYKMIFDADYLTTITLTKAFILACTFLICFITWFFSVFCIIMALQCIISHVLNMCRTPYNNFIKKYCTFEMNYKE